MLIPYRISLGLVCVFASAAIAQPSPEIKKLEYFAGNWQGTLQATASLFGPGGTVTDTYRSEWMPGNMFMRSDVEERSPSRTATATAIMGFDREKKVYVEYDFDGHGDVQRAEGTLTGDAWTWTTQFMWDGQLVKIRSIAKPISATSYDYTLQASTNGTDWQTVRQGTVTKAP